LGLREIFRRQCFLALLGPIRFSLRRAETSSPRGCLLMRAVCTGISGVNRKDYLDDLAYYAMDKHEIRLDVIDLGTIVEKEAARLFRQSHISISTTGIDRKILDLPRSTLRQLSTTAWHHILKTVAGPESKSCVVSLHATFRWKRSLTLIVDTEYLDQYQPDLFFVLKDDPLRIHGALQRDPKWKGKLTTHEIWAWQEEEIAATRILAGYRQRDWKEFSVGEAKEEVYKFLFPPKQRPPYEPRIASNPYRSIYCTSISGTKARDYLKAFCLWAKENKKRKITLLDFAHRIVEEAQQERPHVNRKNILKEPQSDLDRWRNRALESIRDEQTKSEDCIILGHSCFRLKRDGQEQLLLAFDPDLELVKWCHVNPDLYVTFTDNILANKIRLAEEDSAQGLDLDLRGIAMWHDEERFFTRLIAENFGKPHYILPIEEPFETLYRVAYENGYKKVYLSFPITEVRKKKKTADQIFRAKDRLKSILRRSYVVFDPIDIRDAELVILLDPETKFPKNLEDHLLVFKEGSEGTIVVEPHSLSISRGSDGRYEIGGHDGVGLSRSELEEVKEHIEDQIVERDYHLIDQSDWVVVYYPVSDISAGVMSEVIYGFSHGRDVFAQWFSRKVSPFLDAYLTDKASHNRKELVGTLAKYSTQS